MERCPSGLRSTLGKRVCVKSVPRVRIPLSPHEIKNRMEPNIKSFSYYDFILKTILIFIYTRLRSLRSEDYEQQSHLFALNVLNTFFFKKLTLNISKIY